MRVPATGEDSKVVVFGAVDFSSGQLVWPLRPPKDGTAFVAVLDHLVATCSEGPLVVVLDIAGSYQGRLAKDTLSCHCWWADQAALDDATGSLLSRLHARFHQPDPGGIALVHTFCEVA